MTYKEINSKNYQSGYHGEVCIKKYTALLDDNGNLVLDEDGNAIPVDLIEEQSHKNTWAVSAFWSAVSNQLSKGMLYSSSLTYPIRILIDSLADHDKTKTMFTRLFLSPTTGTNIPGGNSQDQVLTTVDENTIRYSAVKRFNPPGADRNIDLVGLARSTQSAGGSNLVAYVVLPSPCLQGATTIVDIYYRLYYISDVKFIDEYTVMGTDRDFAKSMTSGNNVYARATCLTSQYNVPGLNFSPIDQVSNLALMTPGASASSYVWNYQDIGCSRNINISIGNTSAAGTIGASILSYGQTAPCRKIMSIVPLEQPNNTIVQNTIGHAASALGPGRDVNNLPSSRGTMTFDASGYVVKIPQAYYISITDDGNATDGSAKYQVYTRPSVGYQYNSSLQQLHYYAGYTQLAFPQVFDNYARVPVQNVNYYGDVGALHKFLNPFGAISAPRDSFSSQQFDMCLAVLSGNEVVSYDGNGVTLLDVSQIPAYKNYNATSTPVLNVSGAGINQIACDKENRLIYVADSLFGLSKIDVDAGTVSLVSGPSGAGIDSTKCYAVFYNTINNTDLWAVFSGCIALSTDSGATWTTFVPSNTIVGLNDTQANWGNVLQMVVDEFDTAQRMALFTSNLGLIWYCVSASTPVDANNLLNATYATSSLTGSVARNFYNRFRFSNDGNFYGLYFSSIYQYLFYASFGSTTSGSFKNVTVTGLNTNMTSFGSGAGDTRYSGFTSKYLTLEYNQDGILGPIIQYNAQVGTTNSSPLSVYNLYVWTPSYNTGSTLISTPIFSRNVSSVSTGDTSTFLNSPLVCGHSIKLQDGVYFSYVGYNNSYHLCTIGDETTFDSPSIKMYGGLKQYGWDGTQWVEGLSTGRPMSTSPQTLPDGVVTVTFADTQPNFNFVATDYYSTHLCYGTMFDEITGMVTGDAWLGSPMKANCPDIDVTTVPSTGEGSVNNELVSLTNFAPYMTTSNPNEYSMSFPLMGNPGIIVGSQSSLAWSDQVFDSGDFVVKWTAGRFVATSSQNFIVGLVPDSNLVNINSDALSSSEITKYVNTTANMDFSVVIKGSTSGSTANLSAQFKAAQVVQTTTPLQPYGSDGYGDEVTCTLQRTGTNLIWKIDDVAVSTTTISATTPYRLVFSANVSGTFAKEMKASYTNSSRRVIPLGKVANESGKYDPRYWRCPSYTANVDSMYRITIDGTPAEVLVDGVTPPNAGQVQLLSGMGKLWFNAADAGKTIAARYPYQVLPE